MAKELAEFSINVNAIAPGYTRFTHPKPVATAEQVVALEQRALEMQVLRRIGQPEDIAATAAYLASADADQVTGHVIVVDGGGQR
jgi:NAD(P)-dependent dehydrogenase (short-subunit alcohol dehydrogenase family)